MLVALIPSQISNYWPLLKGHIEDSLPPTGDYGDYDINSILYHALAGLAQVWIYHNENQESQGFLITHISTDISGVKTVVIYCAIIIDKTAKVDWEAEFNTLKIFANSRGCSKMASYVSNEKAINALKEYDVETRFVYANINI